VKRWSETIQHFEIRYSIFCGSLFGPATKPARVIIKKPCHFGLVSYERRLGLKSGQSEAIQVNG
jgi:hypothetical protein